MKNHPIPEAKGSGPAHLDVEMCSPGKTVDIPHIILGVIAIGEVHDDARSPRTQNPTDFQDIVLGKGHTGADNIRKTINGIHQIVFLAGAGGETGAVAEANVHMRQRSAAALSSHYHARRYIQTHDRREIRCQGNGDASNTAAKVQCVALVI